MKLDRYGYRHIMRAFLTSSSIGLFLIFLIAGMMSFTIKAHAFDKKYSISHQSQMRDYHMHLPPSAGKGTPLPVVVFLHGDGGFATQAIEQTGWNKTADSQHFIAIYPEAMSFGAGRLGTWNAGICCGDAKRKNINDVGFVMSVLKHLKTQIPYDAKRVYIAGQGNGGMLAYKLACEYPDKIAAIATHAGIAVYPGCKDKRRVPVMHIHGMQDRCMPYEGGTDCSSCWESLLRGYGFPSLAPSMQCAAVSPSVVAWAKWNQCGGGAQRTLRTGAMNCMKYTGCWADVQLCTITDGGHLWPGADYAAPFCKSKPSGRLCQNYKNEVGIISKSTSANEVMWNFFKAFDLVNSGFYVPPPEAPLLPSGRPGGDRSVPARGQ